MNVDDKVRISQPGSYPARYVGKEGEIIEIVPDDPQTMVIVSFPGDQDAAFYLDEVEPITPPDRQMRAAKAAIDREGKK